MSNVSVVPNHVTVMRWLHIYRAYWTCTEIR